MDSAFLAIIVRKHSKFANHYAGTIIGATETYLKYLRLSKFSTNTQWTKTIHLNAIIVIKHSDFAKHYACTLIGITDTKSSKFLSKDFVS